ncbi:MAG: histone deacetylase family protein [Pseudomonadota bacterium]
MQMIFDERQLLHRPETYFRQGSFITHPEQPERAVLIRDRLLAEGHELIAPGDHGEEPIRAVHDGAYVDFHRSARAEWQAFTDAPGPAVPNYHTSRRVSRRPQGIVGKLGYHSTDTACPVTDGTWDAIYWSAQTAMEGAARVAAGTRAIYALCRPPGHHAYKDASNGFCFFNNAAIAAQHLKTKFERVAILDIDTHAGQGTQDIFYDRGDIFVSSIHRDPAAYPPFFAGYEDETGSGPGTGAHRNICLAAGADDATILGQIDHMIASAQSFGAEALVVSLGFDMAGDDPLSEVAFTREGFVAAANWLMAMGLPTVLVQEGGYLGPSLAENAAAFLEACDAAM